ncbi:MAG: hypothetical protein Dbin4_02990 [Alphaproteobacteria bacterium]|nr:hypothetical protein [Alphaproteobacteria bacterium]
MFNLRNATIAFAVGILVGGATAWRITSSYKDAHYGSVISAQKVEAAAILQAETEKVLSYERRNTELNQKLEMENADANAKINAALASNRRLARELGGLRDPGRRQDCRAAGAPDQSPSTAEPDTAGAELSREASEFLLDFAAEADIAATYAKACRGWAHGLINLGK